MTQELNPPATLADDAVQPESGAPVPELVPVAESQRIDVLDVLRGFALIGILMMNIEWFNRAISVLNSPELLDRDFDHGAGDSGSSDRGRGFGGLLDHVDRLFGRRLPAEWGGGAGNGGRGQAERYPSGDVARLD